MTKIVLQDRNLVHYFAIQDINENVGVLDTHEHKYSEPNHRN